jgi:thymidine phosphorylase
MDPNHLNQLKVKSIGIDTYRENIIYMRHDCHVCVAEGFTALTRIVVSSNEKEIIATLNVIHNGDLLKHGEAALSMEAMQRLNVREGDTIRVSHLPPVESLGSVRAKLYGKELEPKAFHSIINDITNGKCSNIELASFIAACSDDRLNTGEVISLTKAMIQSGQKLSWPGIVVDKHCVGGLPGNRTTPIVVSIIAAAGLTIPKTSSRAITSPAGTADTVETFTNVNLDFATMRKVVEQEGGCMAWGGAVKLSPADDILISIERSLDLDSPAQLIASVLSKKAAAGSTHVVIDIPVGESAKVRTMEEATRLKDLMQNVAASIDMSLDVLFTDGQQPVGRGIGPALEALDVIAVLKGDKEAPVDLCDRSIKLASLLLEMTGHVKANGGYQMAYSILESGEAWKKFQAICLAQGRFTEPVTGKFQYDVTSNKNGVVSRIDNRRLAKLAKLCGAPHAPGAGILFLSPLYKKVNRGDLMFTLFAQSRGELEYAKEYLKSSDVATIQIV